MPSSLGGAGLNALLKLEVNSLLSALGQGSTSKDFFDLIKDIGEAKSKQEEDKILTREIARLKAAIAKPPDNTKGHSRELLVRLIYCEMLGHNASFGYIHAIKMTQEHKVLDKRVGYLAVATLLHENSELMMLLINSFRRDLESANFMDTVSALTGLCYLLNTEAIPALLPVIVDRLLDHPRELVRKKAVMVLQRIYSRSPEMLSELLPKVRKALCDRDPSVMSASLCVYFEMVKDNPQRFKEVVPSLVSILKQVIEHRLPVDFEYHKVPAPWIQIKILKILAYLGTDDQRASEHMYEIINETLKRADMSSNAGYAIVYECIQTIGKIYPNNYLLDAAATNISRFIGSTNHNLKYLGITALALLVQVSPRYAVEHQLTVIDCLENPDETLRRKTLDLLYKMTNPKNVVIITDKLLHFLRQTTDNYLRTELVSRITQNAERYAPNNQWFVKTMNTVFFLGGDLVRPEVAHNLMQLIAEGTGEDDEESDKELRIYSVNTFLKSLSQPFIPDVLLQTIAWVLGEYGHLSELPLPEIIDRLLDLLHHHKNGYHPSFAGAAPSSVFLESNETRGWVITALAKLCSQLNGQLTLQVREVMDLYTSSQSVDVQQKCYEIRELARAPSLFQEVFPVDSSCEDIEVDENLTFLNGYVNHAIRTNNARPYIPHHERTFSQDSSLVSEPLAKARPIRWTAYDAPKTEFGILAPPTPSISSPLTPFGGDAHLASLPTTTPATSTSTGFHVPSDSKWSATGYVDTLDTASSFQSPFSNAAASVSGSPFTGLSSPTSSSATSSSSSYSFSQTPSKPAIKTPLPNLEQQKKERLASALFSGVEPSSDSGRKKPKPPKRRVTTPSTTTPSSAVPTPPASSQSLLGSFDNPPPTHPTTTTPPVSSDLDGLLGIQNLAISSPPLLKATPAVAAPSPPLPAANLLDFDDFLPTNPKASISSSMTPNLLDVSSTSTASPTTTAATESFGGLVPMKFSGGSSGEEGSAQSSLVHNQLMGFPRAYETKKILTPSDSQLMVSYNKIWKNDEVVVALYFSNSSSTNKELMKVVTTVDAPANFKSELFADVGASVRQNQQFLVTSLQGAQSTIGLVKLRFRQHSISAALLNIRIQYVNHDKENKHLAFSVPIELNDLLRELPLNTAKFGELWGSHTHETKLLFPTTGLLTPNDFLSFLQSKLNARSIEVIGIEAIAAAKLINAENILLLHGKLNGKGGVDITVRTKDKLFTEITARYLQSILAK